MATNVKILLRRGKRAELSLAKLDEAELGFTTDTNQLYVGLEEPAVNEIQFDPFANAHAIIQSWLNSSDCPSTVPLTVDEDLIVADIPDGEIDNIITALNTYKQEIIFNSASASFPVGELLTQYRHERTIVKSSGVIPNINSITATFEVLDEKTAGAFVVSTVYKILTLGTTTQAEWNTTAGTSGVTYAVGDTFTAATVGAGTGTASFSIGTFTFTTQTLTSLLSTLQLDAAIKAANIVVEVDGVGVTSYLKFTKIDGKALGVDFSSGHATLGFSQATNTEAAVTGYDVYANGTILPSPIVGSGITTVTVQLSESSGYFAYLQEGDTSTYPYPTAPDTSPFFYFGTPSTLDYSAESPAVESTSITGESDTKIGLYGSKRTNVEVLTEESRNQLFTNQHLKSYSAADGLRSDLYKKKLTATIAIIGVDLVTLQRQYEIITLGTTTQTEWEAMGVPSGTTAIVGTKFVASAVGVNTGTVREVATFLKYPKEECTSIFIDYSLKQTNGTMTFVRVGTIRVINGTPQDIKNSYVPANTHYLTKLTDTNTEIHQDLNTDNIVDANEVSNIVFLTDDILIADDDIVISYTQDLNFSTEISYTVKRWTM